MGPPGDGAYMRRYAHIVGWGYEVPAKVITNHDLEQIVETSDEWIRSRTGIEERHVAADPKETTSSLAVIAARRALEVADVPPNKIDLIICSTTTPEYSFPATACLVQNALGATNAGAFDLSAACSGFVYGLSMATRPNPGRGCRICARDRRGDIEPHRGLDRPRNLHPLW